MDVSASPSVPVALEVLRQQCTRRVNGFAHGDKIVRGVAHLAVKDVPDLPLNLYDGCLDLRRPGDRRIRRGRGGEDDRVAPVGTSAGDGEVSNVVGHSGIAVSV